MMVWYRSPFILLMHLAMCTSEAVEDRCGDVIELGILDDKCTGLLMCIRWRPDLQIRIMDLRICTGRIAGH